MQTLIRSPQEEGDEEDEEGAAGFQGSYLELRFREGDVLRLLPRLQLTKPLEVGDELTLPIKGKMRNGAPFSASVTVKIVEDD